MASGFGGLGTSWGSGGSFKPIKSTTPYKQKGNVNFSGGPVQAGNPGQYPGSPPPTPAAGGAAPAAAPPSTPSPYDAQYFVNLAQATNNANNSIAGLQRNIDNGQTNLSNTLAQLEYNKGLSLTRAQNVENQRGGFAQGALGQQLGQISHQYLTTENNDTLKYQQDKGNWEAAIAAAQQGLPLETIALGLASAQRQAALGLEAPPDAAAPAPAPAAAPAPGPGPGPPKFVSTAPEPRSSAGGGKKGGGKSGKKSGGS